VSCPLCGDEAPRARVLRGRGGVLVRCASCGLVTVDPMPSPGDALALYDEAYFRGDRGYRDYLADERIFRAEFRRRLRHLADVPEPRRLLEVGCASGAFLDEARRAGFHARGIEPAAPIAALARERTGLPVDAVPIEEAELPPDSCDAVVMFEILEHLTDPLAALRRLRGALVAGGVLAISVPDFGSLWARLSGRRWPLFTPWEHLVYFTRPTLREVLLRAGFPVVRFAPARTVFSLGTLLHRATGRAPDPSRRVARVGIALPFGTLFAIARAS